MNYNKRTNILSLIIGGLIGITIYIISYQYNNIQILKDNFTNQQEDSSSVIIEQDNKIKYLTEETIKLQEPHSNNIKNLLSYIEPLKKLDKQEYLIQYKNILNEYSEIFDPTETVYDYYTEEEIKYMWKCIETETYQCDFNSKVNVASVILNRIDNQDFPLDPIEIITDKNQFAYGRDIITDNTKLALEYAFMIEDTTNGCIAFRSDIKLNKWNGWDYQFTDDAVHHFYK